MVTQLNFARREKKYLKVILPDDKVLLITTPKKKTFKKLLEISEELNSVGDNIDDSVIEDLYEMSAILMSNNKTNTDVTKEELEDLLDIEDIITFFTSYMQFMNELTSEKN